ncbi:MAG: glycosyltransferase family 2 protein [Solirubrobacteraceae bacterium]|jgi:glycosyltransferase involved in cell wall biosynthesis
MNRYIAIVPAHNEVGAIADTIREIHAAAPQFDVLVIDDGSSDATAASALGAGARVVRLPFNLGIGAAVQSGYIYARRHGYQVAVQVDGDGQHDPRDIPRLLEALQADPQAHFVIGSRFLGPPTGDRSTPFRRVGIALFARVVSLLTHQRVTDPTSGFRMTDRTGIELFARDYPSDYPEVEAIVLAHRHAMPARELAVTMRPRTSGTSRISAPVSVYYLVKVLLALAVTVLRATPPQGRSRPAERTS